MFIKIFRTISLLIVALMPIPYYLGNVYWLPFGVMLWLIMISLLGFIMLPVCWILNVNRKISREMLCDTIRGPYIILKKIWK